MAIISLCFCFWKGDWKHWKLYYPTMLYYIIVSINVSIILDDKPLWLFYGSSPIDRICNYVLEVLVFPSIIIPFLSNFPKRHLKQFFYLLAYVFVFSLFEAAFYVTKEIIYYNGWNLWYSVLLYAVIFPLLILHHRSPIVAWLVTFILTCGIMAYFGISIYSV